MRTPRVYREVVHYAPLTSGQRLWNTVFVHIALGPIAHARHDLAGSPDQNVTGLMLAVTLDSVGIKVSGRLSIALVRQSQGSDAETLASSDRRSRS